MDDAGYALSVFQSHVERASLSMGSLAGKSILELGPGDSVATAIIAHALGARALLLDAGAFACQPPVAYEHLCDALRARGLSPVDVRNISDQEERLNACKARPLTCSVESWDSVESSTVDFIFSQAVLEHVSLGEFRRVQQECFRVLHCGGVASHRVDLKDHLGGALNNLRFSKKVWESPFFVRSGFYTNRIRMQSMLEIFRDAGFEISAQDVRRWNELPTPLDKMAPDYANLSEDDLLVSGFDVVLQRR